MKSGLSSSGDRTIVWDAGCGEVGRVERALNLGRKTTRSLNWDSNSFIRVPLTLDPSINSPFSVCAFFIISFSTSCQPLYPLLPFLNNPQPIQSNPPHMTQNMENHNPFTVNLERQLFVSDPSCQPTRMMVSPKSTPDKTMPLSPEDISHASI